MSCQPRWPSALPAALPLVWRLRNRLRNRRCRRFVVATALALGGFASAQAQTSLPPAVAAALQRAQVPAEALHVAIQELGSGRVVWQHQPQAPVNPASLIKLLTTSAALDTLGPAWSWGTPVWVAGPVREGVLEGAVHIKGTGDPKLVVERVWLLLKRLQQFGVREIRGDIVLDTSAFAPGDAAPGDFDGDALRPYNVKPDALLLNYKSVVYSFIPQADGAQAQVQAEPVLAGVQVQRSVPLVKGECADWRNRLRAQWNEPGRVAFQGPYAAACGELNWPVADGDPASYNARLLQALWQELGGRLTGQVREGAAPTTKPSFEARSPALAEVVRDINKYSNNVMAQQLFFSLPLAQGQPAPITLDMAREALGNWAQTRLGLGPTALVLDNGSGLSRSHRITVQGLARLLQHAHASPWMSELMSSLPISGTDGTLRRLQATAGRAHLKTGSLRDVAGVAGYVLADSGRRYVLVAVLNHANANAARPALDALVQWTMREVPGR
jgi:serine-type D-Ala-D-Ala carboxypeptidase/endopeptidase (penicillin-binding protein 4)